MIFQYHQLKPAVWQMLYAVCPVYKKPVWVLCLCWHVESALHLFEQIDSCQLMDPLANFPQNILSLSLHEILITFNHYFSWKLRRPFCKAFVSQKWRHVFSWQKQFLFYANTKKSSYSSSGNLQFFIFSLAICEPQIIFLY